MGSFDVRSLFTNIPSDFTINLTLENIFRKGVKYVNGLSKLQLKELLLWTTKGTVFQFPKKNLMNKLMELQWAVQLQWAVRLRGSRSTRRLHVPSRLPFIACFDVYLQYPLM